MVDRSSDLHPSLSTARPKLNSEPRSPALATRESQLKGFVTITKMIASHTKPPETPAGASRHACSKGGPRSQVTQWRCRRHKGVPASLTWTCIRPSRAAQGAQVEGSTVSADRRRLFLASFLMLFVELVLIRWLGAHVAYLSFFSNFVLLGSFLGIGIRSEEHTSELQSPSVRSEERRVGKECPQLCRSRWSPYH